MPRRDYIGQYYINSGVVQEIKSIRQQILQLQRSHVKLPPVQQPKNTLTKKPKKKTSTPLPDTTLSMKTFFGDFLRPYPTETFFGGNLPYNKMETFFGYPLGIKAETFFGVELDGIGGGAGGFTGDPIYEASVNSNAAMEALLASGAFVVMANNSGSSPTLTANSDCVVETIFTSSSSGADSINCIFYVYPTGPSPSLTKSGGFSPAVLVPGGGGPSVSSATDEDINNSNNGSAIVHLSGSLTPGNLAVVAMRQVRTGGVFISAGGNSFGPATFLGAAAWLWQPESDGAIAITYGQKDDGAAVGAHMIGAYIEIAPA